MTPFELLFFFTVAARKRRPRKASRDNVSEGEVSPMPWVHGKPHF